MPCVPQARSKREPRCRVATQRHAAALLGTAAAGLRAAPAMVAGVSGALFAAGPAHLGAQRAEGRCQFAAARHGAGSRVARLGAVHVQRNATGRHADIAILMQAGCGALIAGPGAFVAGVDAGKVGMRSHGVLPEGPAEAVGQWQIAGRDRCAGAGATPSGQVPYRAAVGMVPGIRIAAGYGASSHGLEP
jgi:hypothetical protein